MTEWGYVTVESKATLRVCGDCGAVVGDQRRHGMWHVNVIGGLQSTSNQLVRGDDSARGGR